MESPKPTAKEKMRSEVTDAQRLATIVQVGRALFDHTESWESDNIGSDLAYLLWAIAGSDYGYFEVVPGKQRVMMELLRQLFPPDHLVWLFVEEE